MVTTAHRFRAAGAGHPGQESVRDLAGDIAVRMNPASPPRPGRPQGHERPQAFGAIARPDLLQPSGKGGGRGGDRAVSWAIIAR